MRRPLIAVGLLLAVLHAGGFVVQGPVTWPATSSLAHAAPAPPPPPAPIVSAPSAVVIDGWTGRVLFAKNAGQPRYPASTTKIMTALVVLRRHVSLKRIVTIGTDAASIGGSTANLYPGERLTVWDLLHALLLPSGNDAAEALADFISFTPDRFVRLMNRSAIRLGLWHTRFLTPDGLDDPGQFTTARDLARLARIAMQMPKFAAVVRIQSWTGHPLGGAPQTWQNLNKLLSWNRSIDGVKTGTTGGAGACLVSSAHRNGHWVIGVNLGSTVADRFSDGMALLNYGFLTGSTLPSTL